MKKNLGTCPVCKIGTITENQNDYSCNKRLNDDEICKFTIQKRIFSKEISPEIVMQLLQNSDNCIFDDFISKEGKNFTAKLKIEGGFVKIDFDLGTIPDLRCCNCDEEIVRTKKGYACKAFFKNECSVFVFQEIGGITLSIEDVKDIISGSRTKLIKGFTSFKGNKFNAHLYLDELTFKVEYEFPDNTVGVCPKCKEGHLKYYPKIYSCSNWNREDNPCNFKIWKNQSGGVISLKQVETLLKENKVIVEFKTKEKIKYNAEMVLDNKGDITINKM